MPDIQNQLPDASIPELPGPYTDPKAGDLLAIYDHIGAVTKKIDVAALLPASPSSNYKFISTFNYGLDAIVEYGGLWYVSLQADNQGNLPTEAGSLWWEERNKSASGLVLYQAGIFSQDEAFVLNELGGFTQFFRLSAGAGRPFNSINFYKELAEGAWLLASETGYHGFVKNAHGFVVNDVLTHKGGAWEKAIGADDSLAIVIQAVDVNSVVVRLTGNLLKGLAALVPSSKYYRQADSTIGTTGTDKPLFVAISATEAVLLASGGGAGSSGPGIADNYTDIAELLSEQGDQENNALYFVTDASTDPTVNAGWAVYRYLGTTAGTLADYQKLSEEESLDVIFSIADASETVKGLTEEATDAETQAGTAIGGTSAKLFVTPAKLATWWTWVKTQAQTITAKWTFTNINISGQTSTGSNRRPLVINNAGDVVKSGFVNFDESNARLEIDGNDNLDSKNLRIRNFSGDTVFEVQNNFTARVFGSVFNLEVPDEITNNNSTITANQGQARALAIKDKGSNLYCSVKSNTSGFGRAFRIEKPILIDVGQGFEIWEIPFSLNPTTTTAAAHNVVATIPIPTDSAAEIILLSAKAHATNGFFQGCNVAKCYVRNVADTLSSVADTINPMRLGASSGGFNFNINGTGLEVRFQNDSGTGRLYTVRIVLRICLEFTPE